MERGKTLGEQAREFRVLLISEQISEIDFDKLTTWLDEIATFLSEAQNMAESVSHLRQDYEGRIVGMVKAIAAVDRSGRNYDDAVASLKSLHQMSGEELVASYHRISARFRDMFPTSFRPQGNMTTRRTLTELSVYK